MTNIILCGGSGTRLWPISRTLMPKQFVKLFDDQSLFQLTVERNSHFCDKQYIVSNAEQYFLAMDQIKNISSASFLLEPAGRNTAPAIALACFDLDPEEIVLVTPSDHLIKNQNAYETAVAQAIEHAERNNLVTFGITPSYPETGYGYIEADGLHVKSFKEKPDAKTAQKYIEAGNYYWNSGMFCFKAGIFLEELKAYAPKMYDAAQLAYENANKEDMIRVMHDDMLAIPEDSIDYAVMEQSKKVTVIPSDIAWVLRVDGHTDSDPIHTEQFKSNWELSAARAIAVVKQLVAKGVPPQRLVAAGFGEFQPIDDGDSEEAKARNRRIELKLTER